MAGKLVGYIQVSETDHASSQLIGIDLDCSFTEQSDGGNRPERTKMLKYVRDGDAVVVASMARLGRDSTDLRAVVGRLIDKGVSVRFVQEGFTLTSKLLFLVMAAWANFDIATKRERQLKGIAIAKKNGAYKGRKPSLDKASVDEILVRVQSEKVALLAVEYDVSKETIYKHIRASKK